MTVRRHSDRCGRGRRCRHRIGATGPVRPPAAPRPRRDPPTARPVGGEGSRSARGRYSAAARRVVVRPATMTEAPSAEGAGSAVGAEQRPGPRRWRAAPFRRRSAAGGRTRPASAGLPDRARTRRRARRVLHRRGRRRGARPDHRARSGAATPSMARCRRTVPARRASRRRWRRASRCPLPVRAACRERPRAPSTACSRVTVGVPRLLLVG